MERLKGLLLIILIAFSTSLFAQTDVTASYQWDKISYGKRYVRIWADSVFKSPYFTDHYTNGTTFQRKVDYSANYGSTFTSRSLIDKGYSDSAAALRLLKTDTSAMLTNYVRAANAPLSVSSHFLILDTTTLSGGWHSYNYNKGQLDPLLVHRTGNETISNTKSLAYGGVNLKFLGDSDSSFYVDVFLQNDTYVKDALEFRTNASTKSAGHNTAAFVKQNLSTTGSTWEEHRDNFGVPKYVWGLSNLRSASLNYQNAFTFASISNNTDSIGPTVIYSIEGRNIGVLMQLDSNILFGNMTKRGASTISSGHFAKMDFFGRKFRIGDTLTSSQTDMFEITGSTKLNGVKFASGTTSLNYYQKGTFTVTATCGTSGTITLSNNTLEYQRTGDIVQFWGTIDVASVSSPVGFVSINGLPFAAANRLSNRGSVTIRAEGLSASATTSITGFVLENTSTFRIYKYAAGTNSNLAGDVQASSVFTVSGFYSVN